MNKEPSRRIIDRNQAHAAAIGGEMARRVIAAEAALGATIKADNIDGRIDAAEQAAADGYLKNPASNRDGQEIVRQFTKDIDVYLASRLHSAEVKAGTVAVNEEAGITPGVARSVEQAMGVASGMMVSDIYRISHDAHTNTALASRDLKGPSRIELSPGTTDARTLAVFGSDPEGVKAKALIFEMLGVTQDDIKDSFPIDFGISRDGQFSVEHYRVSTEIEGIELETHEWAGQPGVRDEVFTELVLKKAETL